MSSIQLCGRVLSDAAHLVANHTQLVVGVTRDGLAYRRKKYVIGDERLLKHMALHHSKNGPPLVYERRH